MTFPRFDVYVYFPSLKSWRLQNVVVGWRAVAEWVAFLLEWGYAVHVEARQ